MKLPHAKYSILWILHVGVGLAAAHAAYGSFRWDLAVACLVGIFFLAMFQHATHVLSGTSSTYRPEDFGNLRLQQAVFACLGFIVATYIIYYRPWATIGIVLGFILTYLYPRTHIEELWGIGWAIGMNTAMYIASGYITLGSALVLAGIGYITAPILMFYRAVTGDYSYDKGRRVLLRGVMAYIIALTLMIAGFALWTS